MVAIDRGATAFCSRGAGAGCQGMELADVGGAILAYLAVTLTISSPVIVYYFCHGPFTAAEEHWIGGKKAK